MLILSAEDYTGASPVKPGGTAPHYLSFYTDALSAERRRVRRLRRRRPRPHRAGRPRRAQPLRRGRLVHGRRRRHARARLGARATRRGWRCRSCTRCATSSTRAGACSTPASAPDSSTRPALGTAALRPVRERAVPRRPGRRGAAAWPSRGPATRRATRSSTCSAPRSRRPAAASTPTPAIRSTSPGSTIRSTGLSLGFNGADSAQNQGIELVVHRDRRLPQGDRPGGQLPAVRELAGGGVPERPRGPVRSAHGRRRSCGRIAPTRRTSA